MQYFFIADPHLGHAHSIAFDGRPFASTEEMDKEIIRRWNRKVRPDDHVYVIGDFTYRNTRPVAEYAGQLNGKIHLVRGNHDKRGEENESCFYEVTNYKKIVVPAFGKKCRLVLCHYFLPFYRGALYGAIMLHGHTHKTFLSSFEECVKTIFRRIGLPCAAYNVGAMWQDYEPQTLEEIIARADTRMLKKLTAGTVPDC